MKLNLTTSTRQERAPLGIRICPAITPLLACGVFAASGFSAPKDKEDEYADAEVFLLEGVVVTGVAAETTKVKSSVAISTVDAGDLVPSAPRSTAEIFRSIPGIRSEATSGDGNANIAVRGLPVAAGGAKFLQLQEDGLPILEFGDIAFGTADGFLRPDYTTERVEAIRGGSASTFASNSPGGIVNFISRTGAIEGGSLGLTTGLDYDSMRLDFNYGKPLGDDMQYHVGGYYRVGEGVRDAGYDGNKGGQIKANFTKFMENGYARFFFKHLDDRAVTYMPMPVMVSGTNANPSMGALAGFDPLTDTPHTPAFIENIGTDGNGNRRVSDPQEGLRSLSTAFGAEFSFDLNSDWKLVDRFRYSDNSGRFVAPFPAQVAPAQEIADSVAGAGSTLRYATGENEGSLINPASLNGNGLLMRVHMFDTELNDFNNMVNDLKLTRHFNGADSATYDLTLGYYHSTQNINMDWLWNSYLLEVKGSDAQLVDVFDSDGLSYSDRGLIAYGTPFWGGLHRNYDTEYSINAPYIALAMEKGKFNMDASVRFDFGDATGSYAGTRYETDVDLNQDGSISIPEQSIEVVDTANRSPVDYDWDYYSLSVGGNYAFTEDYAAFARFSRGGRANADRLLFGPNILANGSLRDDDAAVDIVEQFEAGIKYANDDFAGGVLGLFATAFFAETEEQNYEATTQVFLDRVYEATGLELESSYRRGNFDLKVGMTWTDAEITSDALNPSVVGNTPRRQADLMYQISPSYNTEKWSVGGSLIGTTDSYAQDDNVLVMPGYEYVNLFGSYRFSDSFSVLLTVNNAFDEFGLSESEEGAIPDNGIIRARGIAGTSSALTFRYDF
ncbi:TonB-dependent receptor [Pelagicoccus sp. SDUM812005]|uniref:TonB-dependent receptor n=1 Tax=Pelagicoccus sp. SDUM812005 TaxID=3041257 RepID=UPI00280D266A|nr:TonB-dependent receptor [Pelagicoccus sp. SDUM812005]MDQ8180410.1 TonB-dependent receptor [Pelagicoccus sp. SDUM812005]